MCKMMPTDFVLTLPNIPGHRGMCIKSHEQNRLIPPRVRREYRIPVKMAKKPCLVCKNNKTLARISLSCMIEVYQTISALSLNFTVTGSDVKLLFSGVGHFLRPV